MPQRGFFVDENVASLTLESAALDALGVSEPVVLSAGTLVVSPFARLCASAAVENGIASVWATGAIYLRYCAVPSVPQ